MLCDYYFKVQTEKLFGLVIFFSFAPKNLFLITLVLRLSNYNLGNWFSYPYKNQIIAIKRKMHCTVHVEVCKYIPPFFWICMSRACEST